MPYKPKQKKTTKIKKMNPTCPSWTVRKTALRHLPQPHNTWRRPVWRALTTAALLLLVPVLAPAEPAWFSDTPPGGQWAEKARSAHGGPIERGRRGVYVKRLWLRSGTVPADAGFLEETTGDYVLQGPENEALDPAPFTAEAGHGIRFEMPEEGFYNAFYLERRVADKTLLVDIAKAEVLKHSCAEGHDRRFTLSRMPPRRTEAVPFEILRERLPGEENFHSHLTSGDRLVFRVLHQGEPATGASVELVSQDGWRKRVTTGPEGRAAFRMVSDYHPRWPEFDEGHRQRFLVTAEYRTGEAGEYQGQPYAQTRYRANLSGAYYPAEAGYMSYVYGFGAFLIALLATGAGIYHYRLRQRRPSPRESFDEKA